jgi:hypothetical protein
MGENGLPLIVEQETEKSIASPWIIVVDKHPGKNTSLLQLQMIAACFSFHIIFYMIVYIFYVSPHFEFNNFVIVVIHSLDVGGWWLQANMPIIDDTWNRPRAIDCHTAEQRVGRLFPYNCACPFRHSSMLTSDWSAHPGRTTSLRNCASLPQAQSIGYHLGTAIT